MDDPYSKLIKIMRKEGSAFNPPSIMFAEVINPYPNLIISTQGIQLDRDNLLVCQNVNVQELTSGEKVLIIPTDNRQMFVLIDKVVSL